MLRIWLNNITKCENPEFKPASSDKHLKVWDDISNTWSTKVNKEEKQRIWSYICYNCESRTFLLVSFSGISREPGLQRRRRIGSGGLAQSCSSLLCPPEPPAHRTAPPAGRKSHHKLNRISSDRVKTEVLNEKHLFFYCRVFLFCINISNENSEFL